MNVVSVHFPKAGGHSLLVQLRYLLGDSLLVDYEHDPLGPHGAQLVEVLPFGVRMVHGHFRAARYDRVREAIRFTFLRHPVENLLSKFFFWKTFPESDTRSLHAEFLRCKPTIEEFAQWGPIRRLMSETYFGGYDMARFDYIGFLDTRSADYQTLSELIGLPLNGGVHFNESQDHRNERAAIKNETVIMRRLTALLADDIRFYERQREIWS